MDPTLHIPSHQHQHSSLYGFDLTQYAQRGEFVSSSAYDAAVKALTHGEIQPIAPSLKALDLYERAALSVLEKNRDLMIQETLAPDQAETTLALYVNTLGRLHIRLATLPHVLYDEEDRTVVIGYAPVTEAILADIGAAYDALLEDEAEAFAEIKSAMDRIEAEGGMARTLEEVIDHVEHVESVGFFVGERFLALIDRFVNLIDHRKHKGFLSALRDKSYAEWTRDETLTVAAIHSLFLSGRAVRFEEFNGATLTARDLLTRLRELTEAYTAAGCEAEMPEGLDLFDRARVTMRQAFQAPGKPWLRYRWVYGLNFMKSERILRSTASTEGNDVWVEEFGGDFKELVGDNAAFPQSEHIFMAQLAQACVARDVAGVPCDKGSAAATSWVEYLMEKIVASAVRATKSDYGMSSSLRDLNRLVTYDEPTLVDEIHALTVNHFFTCYVSADMIPRLGEEEATVIATSVQKRMMFNRWHFIPGNLERPLIRKTRHWYFPPMVPDIAIHADMHRAAHNRARIKHSIRSPGPDMSRPPLFIANQYFRGFYDIRVVRMEGDEYTMEDLLRSRRRTLWLESLYAALAQNAMRPDCVPLMVKGFAPGAYADIAATESRPAELALASGQD
jgi:hypothetical protein